MKESKTVKCLPADEQFFIDVNQRFKWELVSSQEIFAQDTRLESRYDGDYSVTTTTNYIKLVFSRDTEKWDVNLINKLQKEEDDAYAALKAAKAVEIKSPTRGIKRILFSIAVLGYLVYYIIENGFTSAFEEPSDYGIAAIFVLILLWGIAAFKKYPDKYDVYQGKVEDNKGKIQVLNEKFNSVVQQINNLQSI